MADHITARDQQLLDAIAGVAVPASARGLLEDPTPRVVAATLVRAGLADKLLARVRANARTALRLYMEALSVKYTQARWTEGLEYALWRATTGSRQKLSAEEATQLAVLAEESGGWWMVPYDTDEPTFEPLADWRIRYADWADGANQE